MSSGFDQAAAERAVQLASDKAGLTELVASVDRILEAVATDPPAPAVEQGDEARSFLVVAYGRAYRATRSVRLLAAAPNCEADDAIVVCRTLVSVVARSLWLAEPEHLADRAYRFLQWRCCYAHDERFTLVDLRRQGFEVDRELYDQVGRAAKSMKGVEPMPGDRALLKELGLSHIYAQVHRRGSDVAHWSLGSAADGFIGPVTPGVLEGRTVPLQNPQPERAALVLAFAAITYGTFLERCEPFIRHGQTGLASSLLRDWTSKYGDESEAGV